MKAIGRGFIPDMITQFARGRGIFAARPTLWIHPIRVHGVFIPDPRKMGVKRTEVVALAFRGYREAYKESGLNHLEESEVARYRINSKS